MKRAFTLIEVLIALGLSAVICLTAFAALRVSAQSVTVINRLSLENGLMRAGFAEALDELDVWTTYDDPSDPAKQILRSPGRPFAPLDIGASGFDTDYDPSDAKTWYRGPIMGLQIWENSTAPYGEKFGDYSVHSGLAFTDLDPQLQRERRWTANLTKTVSGRLGYYATIDYAPRGFVPIYFDEAKQMPPEFWDAFNPGVYAGPGGPIKSMCSTSGSTRAPRDFLSQIASAYTISTNPDYLSRDIDHHYFWWWKHINIFEEEWWQSQKIHDACGVRLTMMTAKPETWPNVDMVTHHVIYSGREVHYANLRMTNPLTSQIIHLYLRSTATTLRGARRQRGLDSNEVTP